MRTLLCGAVLALVLAGCGGHQDTPAPPGTQVVSASDSPAPPVSTGVAALPASPPTEITIPKINAKSTLIPLGLNADETIQVPPVEQPMQAGWYDKAPTPGETGPAIILGHVDGKKKPGIFFRLREMAAGDEIVVSRKDGTTARFRTTRVEQFAKRDFPADVVYGDTEGPELRLITCGGVFDRSARSYQDNIVVFAQFVPPQS